MKECPQCKSTYQDDSLSFCLSDGTALVPGSGYDSEATVQLPRQAIPTVQNNPARVQVPIEQPTAQTFAPVTSNTAEKKGSGLMPILAVVSGIGILLLGGVVFTYFALSGRGNVVTQNTAPQTPVNTTTPGNTDKTAQLEQEINKLKKMIEDQANANKKAVANKPVSNTAASKPAPAPETSEIKIATVNSPGDGFLAMRSGPSSKTGVQIMKMPHGASVAVGACQGTMVKSGRWCRVAYSGQTGWAFDGYLIYQ